MSKNIKVVVYGFGSTGKKVVDDLMRKDFDIIYILDKNLRGEYKKIPIIGFEQLLLDDGVDLSVVTCVIALHNHYIDISPIYDSLIDLGFLSVHTIVSFNRYLKSLHLCLEVDNGYWYEADFLFEKNNTLIDLVGNLLSESKSISLYLNIIKYRQYGLLEDCPIPSLTDEYIPLDLPKYREPIRLIDCGAHTGLAIDRIHSAGYKIESIIAFEPNLANFSILSEKSFGSAKITYLPLGVWHTNKLLTFANQDADSTSGSLSSEGDDVIQCVRLDSVIKNQDPTLILFDIEGAELDALIGMEATIRKSRPVLCISLYHRPMHIFQIPMLINGWNLNYKFHIRVHEYNTFGLVLYCFQD